MASRFGLCLGRAGRANKVSLRNLTSGLSQVDAAPNHEMFKAPVVTYCPYSPGGSVGGQVSPGWEPVQQAFAQNFSEGLEKGAQLVIRVDGTNVVDIYGYSASCTTTKHEYDGDTLQNIYSSGKQIETLVAAMLVDRGLISYDEKVATYWPEFAQGDKGDITIAMVLRHEGGCPWFLDPNKCRPGDHGTKPDHFRVLSNEALLSPEDIDRMIETNPRVQYGKNHDGTHSTRTYHALTRGLLLDGVLRRVDPAGRGMAQFVEEEICKPLGVADYHVALTEEEQAKYNIAHIGPSLSTFSMHMEFGPTLMGLGYPDLMGVLNFMSPQKPMMMSQCGLSALYNEKTGRFDPSRAALPHIIATPLTSAFNNSSARAQALIYATYAEGGSSILSAEAVERVFEGEERQMDGALNHDTVFTQGGVSKMAELHSEEARHAAVRDCFKGLYGWEGMGGSKCMVDREKRVTFIYTISGMSTHMINCPRMNRILRAYQQCITK